MKKLLFIILVCFGHMAKAQTTGYLRYDTVKMAKVGGTTEMILQNATSSQTLGVLRNVGNGRVIFSPTVDSLYVNLGADSIIYNIMGVRRAFPFPNGFVRDTIGFKPRFTIEVVNANNFNVDADTTRNQPASHLATQYYADSVAIAHGGGGTPTWQQTLTAGSVLTANNTITSPTGRQLQIKTNGVGTTRESKLRMDTLFTDIRETSNIGAIYNLTLNSGGSQLGAALGAHGSTVTADTNKIELRSAGNTNDVITINSANGIQFAGTGNYEFPRTTPSTGDVLTSTSGSTLGWAPPSGASPAGNYGNVQLNRNGVFSTPASDSFTVDAGIIKYTGLIQSNSLQGAVSGGTSVITVDAGNVAFGNADNGKLTSTGNGNLVTGYVVDNDAEISATGTAGFAGGFANDGAIIHSGSSSFNWSDLITASATSTADNGSIVFGNDVFGNVAAENDHAFFTGSGYTTVHDNSFNTAWNNAPGIINFYSEDDDSNPATQTGIGTDEPDASAILDITSTARGFLMPRMTTAQKIAIGSPATGLQVYDTDLNNIQFYNSSTWVALGSQEYTASIDLSGGDYTITKPGIYEVTNANGGVNGIIFPDPATFPGASLTIVNTDGGSANYDNTNTFAPYSSGKTGQFTSILTEEYHLYKSINGKWRGGYFTN